MNLEQQFVTPWQRVPKHVCVVYAERVILSEITAVPGTHLLETGHALHNMTGEVMLTCSNPTGQSPIVTSKAHSTTKILWHSQLEFLTLTKSVPRSLPHSFWLISNWVWLHKLCRNWPPSHFSMFGKLFYWEKKLRGILWHGSFKRPRTKWQTSGKGTHWKRGAMYVVCDSEWRSPRFPIYSCHKLIQYTVSVVCRN